MTQRRVSSTHCSLCRAARRMMLTLVERSTMTVTIKTMEALRMKIELG